MVWQRRAHCSQGHRPGDRPVREQRLQVLRCIQNGEGKGIVTSIIGSESLGNYSRSNEWFEALSRLLRAGGERSYGNRDGVSVMQKRAIAGVSPSSRARTRVVIADDHKLVAEAFKHLLEPEFEVVDIALDGHALAQSVGRLKPDVALVDVCMPQLNGLDAAAKIK